MVWIVLVIIALVAAAFAEGWKNGLRTIEVLDMLMHPIVYFAKKGAGTEKFLYHELRHAGVPKKQIFRNVYVPTYDGKYTEIDLLVLSKKGFLVFECKNYGGKVYGDGRATRWHEYIGGKKYDFLNPQIQNAGHIKYLLKYFRGRLRGLTPQENLPAKSFVVFSKAGDLHLKNLREDVYLLQKEGDFLRTYRGFRDAPVMAKNFKTMLAELDKLSHPPREIKLQHIVEVRGMKNKVK